MDSGEHPFTDVDRQLDPPRWVEVLDTVGGEPLYAGYKARITELLDPQPGGMYLEVGTGTGADARRLETRFGVRVVGVDVSHTMVDEARSRGLSDAVVADVHALPFGPCRFDGVWADRVFQHLADPAVALREMVRVTRPGGRIVVVDPDYGTQVVDIADQDLAQRVLRFRSDFGIRNGRLAHQMGRVFLNTGISDLLVEAVPIVLREATALDNALGLRDWASFASERGLICADEVLAWERDLDAATVAGHFLYSFSLFITAGRIPPTSR